MQLREGARVTFTWDGEPVSAIEGEPVAVALYRAGHRVQTRSIKYHRPRGPQCFAGGCPGCLVRVDGLPNQLGCRTPAREGLEVTSQVGRPTAARDVLAVSDRVFQHLDHERAFTRPQVVSRVYEAVARRLAGFGTAPTGAGSYADGRRLSCEVLVVGLGPAGLGAAAAAAEAGADVLAVGEDPGGSLWHHPGPLSLQGDEAAPGPTLAERLVDGLPQGARRIEGAVLGLYEDGIAVLERTPDGQAVHQVTAERFVLCPGANESGSLIPGADAPGVLGARAARILLNRHGLAPGERVAVFEPRREGHAFLAEAAAAGLETLTLAGKATIEADETVEAIAVDGQRHPVDAVVLDQGLAPAIEIAQQAGVPVTYAEALGGRVPLVGADGSTPLAHVFVAGGAAGVHEPVPAYLQGRAAGARAAGGKPAEVGEAIAKRLEDEAAREALAALWRGAL